MRPPTLTSVLRRAGAPAALVAALVAATSSVPAVAEVGRTAAATERAAPPAAPLAPASPDLPGLPPMSADLAAVPVDSASFRVAAGAYGEAAERHAARQAQRVSIDRASTDLAARAGVLQMAVAATEARLAALTSRLDEVERAVADLSVQLYVSGGSSARIDAALTDEQPSINDDDRRAVLADASLDVLLAERAAYRSRVDEAARRLEAAATELDDVTTQRRAASDGRGAAVHEEAQAGADVAEVRVAYEHARVLAVVDGVEFPLVALDAYHRAARTIAGEDPACGVRWWALAGISQVEGRHGTYGGSALDANGDTTRRIIGIQLNGTRDTAVIADTDGGTLDGDPDFDRAVGPMQFIPQTWARFASDGNEDGLTTPFNLYDATLAAARYLCRSSGGLDADPGLRSAYFSYNHSQAYVEQVLAHARRYEQAVEVPAQQG